MYQSYRENSSTQERVSSSILQAFKAVSNVADRHIDADLIHRLIKESKAKTWAMLCLPKLSNEARPVNDK
jgi:hypothetical protein